MTWFLFCFATWFSISFTLIHFFLLCWLPLDSLTSVGFLKSWKCPKTFPQDLILYPPPSPGMLEMVEYLTIMGFCLLYPSPNHSIAFRTYIFYLNVSIDLPLNQFTSIRVPIPSPLGVLGTYFIQLPMAGFTQTEKQTRCRMRSSGSWLSKGSQNTLLRAPPTTSCWKLESFYSWMLSTVSHIKPFTEHLRQRIYLE